MATMAGTPARSIGLGSMKDGEQVPLMGAVWARVPLKSKDMVVEIQHALGRKPSWCVLWQLVQLPGARSNLTTCAPPVPFQADKWDEKKITMWLGAEQTGSYDGTTAVFLIGGE